jgi:hypothetical protein
MRAPAELMPLEKPLLAMLAVPKPAALPPRGVPTSEVPPEFLLG